MTIISNEDALHRVDAIVSKMNVLFRSADVQSRDWTEEFDLLAKHLKVWTRYMSTAAKTDWSIYITELAVQYGYQKPKRKSKSKDLEVDVSGDTYGGEKIFTI